MGYYILISVIRRQPSWECRNEVVGKKGKCSLGRADCVFEILRDEEPTAAHHLLSARASMIDGPQHEGDLFTRSSISRDPLEDASAQSHGAREADTAVAAPA